MKCARCQHDSKKSERIAGHCPKCKGLFAFDPSSQDPFSDVAFAHAISVVSHDGTVRFHARHLYYQLCRQKKPSSAWVIPLVVLCLPGFMLSLLLESPLPCVFLVLLGVAFALYRYQNRDTYKSTALSYPAFEALLARWYSVHGRPKG
jgi:hypothetical protein